MKSWEIAKPSKNPDERSPPMSTITIEVDLAKDAFEVAVAGPRGRIRERKRLAQRRERVPERVRRLVAAPLGRGARPRVVAPPYSVARANAMRFSREGAVSPDGDLPGAGAPRLRRLQTLVGQRFTTWIDHPPTWSSL
jgi:hypothetical protein